VALGHKKAAMGIGGGEEQGRHFKRHRCAKRLVEPLNRYATKIRNLFRIHGSDFDDPLSCGKEKAHRNLKL
jgi:hypothetical protein